MVFECSYMYCDMVCSYASPICIQAAATILKVSHSMLLIVLLLFKREWQLTISLSDWGNTVLIVQHEGINFHEFVKTTFFTEKTFVDCPLLPCQRMPRPNFAEKTFMYSHKTAKFAKVFSLESSHGMFYWTDRAAFNSVADYQYILSLQSTVGSPLHQRMVSLRTSRVLAQWEVLRYSSGATQDIFQLGGWGLLVYYQMEYQ